MATEFLGNDQAYLGWIAEHPNGFILNTYSPPDPGLLMLHRAACRLIREMQGKAEPGGFTERQYMKVCAESASDIYDWAGVELGASPKSVHNCQVCRPL
jgi:hypothetical protein